MRKAMAKENKTISMRKPTLPNQRVTASETAKWQTK